MPSERVQSRIDGLLDWARVDEVAGVPGIGPLTDRILARRTILEA